MVSLHLLCLHLYPLLRLIFYLLSIYFMGIVNGIFFSILFHKMYLFIMSKLYHIEPLPPQDRMFILNKKEDRFNMVGILLLDDEFNIEKMKERIITRGIRQYKKLRSIQQIKNFEFWWKELPYETILTKYNPFDIKKNFRKFESIKDIVEYCYEELQIYFNLEEELPYKFIMIKNNEGEYKNIVIFKVDHNLADGVGFVGLVTALGDNYSLSLFPQSMKKKGPSIMQQVLAFIQLPYYLLYPFIEHFFVLYSGDTPFKNNKSKTGKPKTCISQPYNFAEFSRINKKMNITFNDMMMALFSSGIKNYCKENYPVVPNNVITINPMSCRGLPVNPRNLVIENDSTGIGCKLKLVDDPIKEIDIIAKEYSFKLRNPHLRKVTRVASDLVNCTLPYFLSKSMYNFAFKHSDILFSNVALPKEPLIYGKTKVMAIYSLLTPGSSKALVTIYSYNGHFNWTISCDRCLELDPEMLMKYIDAEMQKFKEKGKQFLTNGKV